MCSHDQDYPWVIRRNELDLFEDELEDLYERFHRGVGEDGSFETGVLQEQLETEERSDRDLSQRLGFDVLDELPETLLSSREHTSPTDASDHGHEFHSLRAHPLYQQARVWVHLVKPLAQQGYQQGGAYSSEWFRVYANVNLVPLKVFTALSEEMHDDHVGVEVAQEEYHLALVYLQRILESMTLMTFDIEQAEHLQKCHLQTEGLRSAIANQLRSLRRRTSAGI